MHDKKGRPIEVGDVVLGKSWTSGGSKDEPFKVIGASASSETCNLFCISFEPRMPVLTLTANETLLILKGSGSLVDQELE